MPAPNTRTPRWCDGNLITSRQPIDLGAFCREIIGALAQER
jgi:putative intracellular protease/amidase